MSEITEAELEKLLKVLNKVTQTDEVKSVCVTKTDRYEKGPNKYTIKTNKIYQDEFIKLVVNRA